MLRWTCALIVSASGLAGAQELLDLRTDLDFRAEAVEAFAERSYRRTLDDLRVEGRLDVDAARLAGLRGLLARLEAAAAAESGRKGVPRFELHTCRPCGETASAMAGGKLLVGEDFITGLALTVDETAFLLAHETAHVLAEHTREFATAARYFVDNGLRREYWDIQRELDDSLPVQLRMAFVSMQQEYEADYIGLIIGSRAGFDPRAMVTLLEKLRPSHEAAKPSTHPDGLRRVHHAANWMPVAQAVRRSSPAPR